MPLQHNKFNKDRQPEGQMPIMLATVLLQLTVTVTEMAKWLKNNIEINCNYNSNWKIKITVTVIETEKSNAVN